MKQGYSNTEAANSLGVSESAIRSWIKKFGPNRAITKLNQATEIKRLKKEMIYSENYKNRQEARADIVEYIEMFYNSFRRHSHLGNKCPKEYLEIWQQDQEVV